LDQFLIGIELNSQNVYQPIKRILIFQLCNQAGTDLDRMEKSPTQVFQCAFIAGFDDYGVYFLATFEMLSRLSPATLA
jgi:hypothetical protein